MNLIKMDFFKMGIENGRHFITQMFKEAEESQLLDPLTTVIKIGLLSVKPSGTKLAIYDHKICFHQPDILQSTKRWGGNFKKDDLHRLCHPIERFYQWYGIDNKGVMKKILSFALSGLHKLRYTYESQNKLQSNLVVHSIRHYERIINELINEKEELTDLYESYPIIAHRHNEFKNMWLKQELKIVHDLFLLIEQKLEEKMEIMGIVETLEVFLNHKDMEFNEMTFKFKNSL